MTENAQRVTSPETWPGDHPITEAVTFLENLMWLTSSTTVIREGGAGESRVVEPDRLVISREWRSKLTRVHDRLAQLDRARRS